MLCPCKECEKKGCGTYHDQCEEYQKFVKWRTYVNSNERKEKDRIAEYKPKRSHSKTKIKL